MRLTLGFLLLLGLSLSHGAFATNAPTELLRDAAGSALSDTQQALASNASAQDINIPAVATQPQTAEMIQTPQLVLATGITDKEMSSFLILMFGLLLIVSAISIRFSNRRRKSQTNQNTTA